MNIFLITGNIEYCKVLRNFKIIKNENILTNIIQINIQVEIVCFNILNFCILY